MKFSRPGLLLFAILSVVTLACRAVAFLQEPDSFEKSPLQPVILFQDEFSNTARGWDDFEDEDGIIGYREGGYRILINLPNWFFWSTPGMNFANVMIEVDATKIGGPDNNEFGVICRYQDDNNFYFFSISSDGYYGINKFIEGELYLVGMDQMLFNDKIINLGNAANRIKASCVDDHLTLAVNDMILADVKDSDLSDGDVGLIAGTFDETGTDIMFDNFFVSRP
jgi:hypothetical protein